MKVMKNVENGGGVGVFMKVMKNVENVVMCIHESDEEC